MYDNPARLQDSCVSFICDNVDAVCEMVEDPEDPTTTKCAFKTEEDIFIHNNVAEQLLEQWSKTGKLTDSILALFSRHRTHLRKVVIRNSPSLTMKGLAILKGHNIFHLTAEDLSNLTVGDLVTCLNGWTLQNLQHLSVTRTLFGHVEQESFPFAKFENLKQLNVSQTDFNDKGLENCAQNLHHLESLDLSQTKVRSIAALALVRDSLKSLNLFCLALTPDPNRGLPLEDHLYPLQHLRVLDISDDPKERALANPINDEVISVRRIVRRPDVWPDLVSLDLSGRPLEADEKGSMESEEEYDDLQAMLISFMACHKRLGFLGLALTEASQFNMFADTENVHFRPDMRITGEATENQILLSLSTYVTRPYYMQKTLYYLFHLTQGLADSREDVVTLLFPIMKRHKALPVQLAATACLYNLIKQELSAKIHPSCLSKVVDVTLDAMETHSTHQQLQKNTLLTLCSDKILQDIDFDRYRCARLVLECLCQFEDASMNRMCVAICGILAAKISTEETSLLGSKPQYMGKLLQIVQLKLDGGEVDITLKFTLSALWNLTDESPSTCETFLKEGGLDLFVRLLNSDRFKDESSIETKVLGLLNNLAEVKHLRTLILRTDLITVLSTRLLASDHIDVSYFAAGILSHLCSGEDWGLEDSVPRQGVLAKLENRVLSWANPNGEMVAYRSFRPFFTLLHCNLKEVQLWAIWAIRHVCTKSPVRYCPMLKEEGGDLILKEMAVSASGHLLYLLNSIMELLELAERKEDTKIPCS